LWQKFKADVTAELRATSSDDKIIVSIELERFKLLDNSRRIVTKEAWGSLQPQERLTLRIDKLTSDLELEFPDGDIWLLGDSISEYSEYFLPWGLAPALRNRKYLCFD
jgi:hypothetical protein